MRRLVRMMTIALLVMGVAQAWGQQAKLIDLSWSNPTLEFLQKHLADMERHSPLDGIVIRVYGEKGTHEGKSYTPGREAWGRIPWNYASFDKAIKVLNSLPFKQFTDNFFYLTVSPGDADWFSDEDFACVVNNFQVAARVSKEGGLKGFLFDIEEYGKKFWRYVGTNNPHSKRESLDKAFQRGQEWGRAVFSAFPDIRIIMPFMVTYGGGDNLALSFVDGVLSVMTPQAKIFEGHEAFGYRARRPMDYYDMQRHFLYDLSHRVRPENRQKFLTQCSVAPAFYMDAIMAPRGSQNKWHCYLKPEIDEGDGAMSFLRRNLSVALDLSSDYIWLYSEKGAWWSGGRWPTWESKLPGIVDMVRSLHDWNTMVIPADKNMLANPTFKEPQKGDSKGWKLWQIEDDQKKPAPGYGTVRDGKCVMRKITSGCYTQNIPVVPGKCYLIVFRGGNTSQGTMNGAVAFMNKQKQWVEFGKNLYLRFPNVPEVTGQGRCFVVPDGVYFLSFQLGASGLGPQGEVFFTYAGMMEL